MNNYYPTLGDLFGTEDVEAYIQWKNFNTDENYVHQQTFIETLDPSDETISPLS